MGYVGAIIGAAATVGTAATNSASTGRLNRKNRNFSQYMYDQQQDDALANWNRQNEYNTPKAEMQRLRDAGLNPNLVYGHGSSASNAGPINQPGFDQPRTEAPQIDGQAVGNAISNFTNIKQNKLVTDQLSANLELTRRDQQLKEAQTLATLAGVDTSEYNLNFRKELKDIEQATIRERLANLTADTFLKGTQNAKNTFDIDLARDTQYGNDTADGVPLARQEGQQRIAEGQARIDQIKQSIINMKQQERLNKFEERMNELNLTKSDPAYLRALEIFYGYLK